MGNWVNIIDSDYRCLSTQTLSLIDVSQINQFQLHQ